MDVRLPNGTVIRGVPDGTPKDEIMRKAIAAGLATEADFGIAQPAQQPVQPERTIGDRLRGGAEVAATMATGAIAQPLSGLAGLATLARTQDPAQAAARQQQVEQRLTFQPGDVGQEYLQNIANAPIIKQAGEISQGAGEYAGRKTLDITGSPTAAAIAEGLLPAAGFALGARASQAPRGKFATRAAVEDGALVPTQEAFDRSVGAAQVEAATVRNSLAQELPAPIKVTTGQATRDFAQQQFEREVAKQPELGDPIRQRYLEQNQALLQNFDEFIDATGAQSTDLRSTGLKVDKAIRDRAARDKAEIRKAYQIADRTGETAEPVQMQPLADYLNQNRAGRTSAPILKTLSDELEVREIGTGRLEDGTLQVGDITLKQAEELRKTINRFAKDNDPNDLRIAADLKKILDDQTADAGGEAYKRARQLRARFAQNYENIGIIKNIIGSKRGSSDRQIAVEDVFSKSILGGSLDDVRQLRRILQTEGANGKSAWNELQGATANYIREQATRSSVPDSFGNQIVSAAGLDRAIKNLDKSGKLDFVFGKKGANQMRLLNDVAKDILTAPPGSVNTSNTASVLLAALDMGTTAAVGVPAPILSAINMVKNNIKDRKIRAKVEQALKGDEIK